MPSPGPTVREMGEVLNLRNNRDIRDYDESMSHTRLAQFMGSNRLGLAASLTGLAINVTFVQLKPPFCALAGVNAWQSGVDLVNRHRTKKEIKRRVNEDRRLKDLFQGRRRGAVFTSVCLKVFTAGLGLGLEDLGSVADAFVKHEGVVPDYQLPSAIIDDFKSEYPNLAATDNALHALNSGTADAVGDQVNGALLTEGTVIETETTTETLSEVHDNGNTTGPMVATVAASGVVSEVTQPVMLVIERDVDAYRNHRFDQTQYNDKLS